MRILLVGAGGVGAAVTSITARRDFFDTLVVATRGGDRRFVATTVDASSADAVTSLCRAGRLALVGMGLRDGLARSTPSRPEVSS